MKIASIKTHRILPGESLISIIKEYIPKIENESILVITSKIVSLSQNRVILKEHVGEKLDLIKEEADYHLTGDYIKQYGICLTIKNNILIPTAGIDESNSKGAYILYPEEIQKVTQDLWRVLKTEYQCDKLGLLITDSHTTPLRRGVSGIALSWCGFQPLHNYIGKPDIYGNALRVTQLNILDCLASAAVLEMGEGDEQTPLALIQHVNKIIFQNDIPTKEELNSISIPIEQDIYAPLINSVKWTQAKPNKQRESYG